MPSEVRAAGLGQSGGAGGPGLPPRLKSTHRARTHDAPPDAI